MLHVASQLRVERVHVTFACTRQVYEEYVRMERVVTDDDDVQPQARALRPSREHSLRRRSGPLTAPPPQVHDRAVVLMAMDRLIQCEIVAYPSQRPTPPPPPSRALS